MSFDLTTLGEFATIQGGFAYKSQDFITEPGIPVLKIKNIRHGFIDYASLSYVSEEVAHSTTRWFTEKGDILISMTGSGPSAPESLVGRVARVWENEPKALINQRVGRLILREKEEVHLDFLYFLLSQKETQSYLVANSTGSANQVNISSKTIEGVPCPRVGFNESKEISDFLNILELRARLLRETNKTLESIAQAIFKSWFVDFDPVHAKMEGRQPEGMDEATAALFPDSFEESELGLIPRGWQVKNLDKVANYLNGLALQKFPPTGTNDLPVIKIAQLRKGDVNGADLATGSIKQEYIVHDGDVLFSWSGSLEVEIWCGGDGALNQHLFKVTSNQYPKWFYYLWTKHHLSSFRQIAASKATTMGHIQRKHLSDAMATVPCTKLLDEANKVFAPMIDLQIENALRMRNLSAIRDLLLPRLISGQLRLPEAQNILEETIS